MSLDLTEDKWTLVMAWCRHPISHYLSQCWPKSVSPYGFIRPQWIKLITRTPIHLKHEHIEAEAKCPPLCRLHFQKHFHEWNVSILIKISLKFVLMGPINYIPALVQIMAWCRPGNRPLSEPMMVSLLTHIYATHPQWVNSLRPSDTYMRR